jgi:lipopolysaccharide assembly outer membrane protein LptD (OstA)
LTVLLLLAALSQDAEPDSAEIQIETIAYSSDSLVFHPGSRDLLLVGASRIDYREMSLEADTVEYDAPSGTVVASGAPELFDRGESIRGERMYYDLSTRRGRIDTAASQYDFGYYSGSSITQVGSRVFNIEDARVTTCSSDSLDYYFFSPMMRVYQDDKAVARPVYMYVSDTPVFYFPYWVFPIRRGRQSGFTLPKFGQTSRDGRYLRELGYYFAFSDYLDLLVTGDIMEKTRFALSARERHSLRYVHHGSSTAEWRREFQTGLDRWRLLGEHMHDFPDGTALRLRGEFLSDSRYLEETQQTPEERMSNEIRSWISINRSFGRASMQVVLDRTSYLRTDPDSIPDEIQSTQDLPDARLSIPSSPIFGGTGASEDNPLNSLYWNLSAHYLSTDTKSEEGRETHSGIRARSDVTGSWRAGGILSLSPRLTATATGYDRDRTGTGFPWWVSGSASITASTDLYGVFGTRLFGFSALRHTLTPSVVLSLEPGTYLAWRDGGVSAAPADSADDVYYSFSDFSPPSERRTVSFSLFQSLEAKRTAGTRVEKQELATLELSTSADLTEEGEIFSPLRASLGITPSNALSLDADATWDLYGDGFQEVDFTTTLRLSGSDPTLLPDSLSSVAAGLPIRSSLSHYYRLGLDDQPDLSKLRATASLNLTPGWSIEYNAYYDLLDGSFVNQSYTLRRDLHCWEAVFVRNVSDVDTGFYFRINIKELPDIKIEQHVSNF